ncbi:extracellular solute-binding protein [Cohnella phaseoli]|uniref:extracellular solute-binding protein n=1 Tax=Cohnella phaseoli TaxID=456490 RepID=UPI0015F29BA8|nr:extracellular solute-binding protein [Cohnella phaseoli]
MKLKKQSISIAIATTLLLSLVTACSSSGNDGTSSPTNEPTASATAQASASEETGSGTNGKFDPPVTINTVGCVVGTELFKGDETQENNVATKWAKESLGIDVKYMWMTKEDQCSSKIRLALSSNEALPDVLFTYDQQLVADLTQSGKLMDLGEAFDKYASDEFKSSLSDATLWYKGMKDGKRYALPVLESRHQNEPLFWFREDWLKKLELQAPKTIEDLEAVMDAFVNRDPDGNNEKDTVGISLGFANGFNQNMADTSWLFGAYGAMPGFYIKGADGKLLRLDAARSEAGARQTARLDAERLCRQGRFLARRRRSGGARNQWQIRHSARPILANRVADPGRGEDQSGSGDEGAFGSIRCGWNNRIQRNRRRQQLCCRKQGFQAC